MHVLVTGGCGFVGSHVVAELLAAGHRVRVLDDLSTGRREYLPDAVELQVGDVADASVVRPALAGVDAVCHQAAKVGLGSGVTDLADYVGRNDLGTAVLVSAMAATDAGRLVLASSMVVYGEGGYACPEHGAVRPRAARGPGRRSIRATLPDMRRAAVCARGRRVGSARPAKRLCRVQGRAGAPRRSLASVTGRPAVALRYHNVYGRRLPRNTPYAGVAALSGRRSPAARTGS